MSNALFENAYENSAHLSQHSSTITFSTTSDALFACLLSKYDGLAWALVDDILELFQNIKFNAKEVTFRRMEDYCERVSQERRVLAQARSAHSTHTYGRHGSVMDMPSLVLDLTAAQLFEDWDPHVDHPDNTPIDEETTLLNMSLVHRSWTPVAQGWLRRRLIVGKMSKLGKLLESPHLGPWVSELQCSDEKSNHLFKNEPSSREMTRFLCGIIQKCPNLKKFYLRSTNKLDTTEYSFFNCLSSLTMLEDLRLHCSDFHGVYAYEASEAFWGSLKSLTSLKSLSLFTFFDNFHAAVDVPDYLSSEIVSVPSLSLCIMDARYFLWLTNRITLPSVTTLRVVLGFTDDTSENRCAELRTVIHRCPSLKELVLCILHPLDFRSKMLTLPHWTQSLQLYFPCYQSTYLNEDETTIPLLAVSPHLKELTICTESTTFPSEGDAWCFENTRNYCEENEVKLHLLIGEGPPLIIYYPP